MPNDLANPSLQGRGPSNARPLHQLRPTKNKMRIERRRPVDTNIGPFSGQERLDAAILDGRTILSRIYRSTVQNLTNEIGNPTAMEQIVIDIAASRLCRVYLANKKFFETGEIETKSELIISWMSSLTRDLALLGLQRRKKDIEVSLSDIVRDMNASKESDGGEE